MDCIASIPIREVAIFLPGSDRPRIARKDIMGILIANQWRKEPNDTGWQHALATCLRAMQGDHDASKARSAFVNVARGAGFKVLPAAATTCKDREDPEVRRMGANRRPANRPSFRHLGRNLRLFR